MRKIERDMIRALTRRYNWAGGNTQVTHDGERCQVFLHGHEIATGEYDQERLEWAMAPNLETLRSWPTRTTKSRLRALLLDVSTCKGVTYYRGEEI